MTIAISLKVNDGLVLAADSASSIIQQDGLGNAAVVNVYNNANKIFNLKKGYPIGAITWGVGNLGSASISTLMKDLRKCFDGIGVSEQTARWQLPESYSVQQVANLVKEFFIELYQAAFKDGPEKPLLGFVVAGYSTNESFAEEYEIQIIGNECIGPKLIRPLQESGVTWYGQIEAITRLMLGYSSQMPHVLHQELGIPIEQISPVLQLFQQKFAAPLVSSAMPIQDAIELAEFLVDLTSVYARFAPGPSTVGGPIEIAAITKHEGFKWIRRKHYYNRELNPEILGYDKP